MARRTITAAVGAIALAGALTTVAPAGAAVARTASSTVTEATAICDMFWSGVYKTPSSEPLARCQWDMALIGANEQTRARATGVGVRIGVIDTGLDIAHPDIAPNVDVAASCSFVRPDDPAIVAGLADVSEAASGDCSNKAALRDLAGHGTHVASIIASPVNGIGVAGVAPEATIVALKACTSSNYCFGYAVADALRRAGDLRLDIVNLSLFADPYLYYCGNDAAQRAQAKAITDAARYAQQRGVLIVTVPGNGSDDLQHPTVDRISPNGPDDTPMERAVGNQCRVLPAEIPGAVVVSATGPIGLPGYTTNIASYSSVGTIDVAAPGGDAVLPPIEESGEVVGYYIQDYVVAAIPTYSQMWFDEPWVDELIRGGFILDHGAAFRYLHGTSMAAPHVTGVAALIKQKHPGWSPGALRAALVRSATPLACPKDWQPLDETDLRLRCYGGSNGWTSFFGHGLVNAAAASRL